MPCVSRRFVEVSLLDPAPSPIHTTPKEIALAKVNHSSTVDGGGLCSGAANTDSTIVRGCPAPWTIQPAMNTRTPFSRSHRDASK